MARSDDERPAELRIGGWLPPSARADQTDGDAAVTELIPVIREPDGGHATPGGGHATPGGGHATPGGGHATPGGRTGKPVEKPAAGSAADGSDRTDPTVGEPAERPARRWRTAVLVAVATAATVLAATAVPLLVDRLDNRSVPDRQARPAPTVALPSDAGPTGSAAPTPTGTGTTTDRPGAARPSDGSRGGDRTAPAPSQPASRSERPGVTEIRPPTAAAPDAAEPGLTLSLEAEQAVRGGRATPRPVSGASGGVVVGWLGDGSANLVRFTVIAPTPGRYAVTFHYVSGEPRAATVTVNGRPAGHEFAATGGWSTVGARTLTLSLAGGQNTITFGGGRRPAPDLDRVVVSGPSA
ncbi:hypothetical protein O7627_19085 [Solwaraspora sp. WMMD1047]|uniref:hypothetical protein n=1 Tax=Solwaraspora sp. WMMD1047 TaxID=3016102 RepID=UPI002415E139|nr:hypothetical protein [Solwaraspora sp. WMMD1047]MDG4831405.1 hypothetical protein [Solwaraspora sp. WMMD1047]